MGMSRDKLADCSAGGWTFCHPTRLSTMGLVGRLLRENDLADYSELGPDRRATRDRRFTLFAGAPIRPSCGRTGGWSCW
jgi:hypothetical protein